MFKSVCFHMYPFPCCISSISFFCLVVKANGGRVCLSLCLSVCRSICRSVGRSRARVSFTQGTEGGRVALVGLIDRKITVTAASCVRDRKATACLLLASACLLSHCLFYVHLFVLHLLVHPPSPPLKRVLCLCLVGYRALSIVL